MGQRSVHQAHTTPANSVHVSALCADMFGDSVCAREADDTAVESWYVPLYEGVHPLCRLDSAAGWRSGCRRAGGLVEPFVRETKLRLEPECITKEEGVAVTRREQRGDGPGTTTRRTQTGPWTLVRTDGSTWGPASLKEEEERRSQIRESGRSFPTDEFFLTVYVLSMCRW